MSDLIKAFEFCGISGVIAIFIIVIFLVLQLIGEVAEATGKVVPEFIKVRKYFKRKRDERIQHDQLLADVKRSLDEINEHYSADNITKRNEWMDWVNKRAEVYDEALEDLREMKCSLLSSNELTLGLYININRNRIIDFASKVINEETAVSREEFNRIFKVYSEYEDIIEQYGKTNGEVDVAYRIITEAYENHMKNHSFIEDLRGY